jgi:hypothetical protein
MPFRRPRTAHETRYPLTGKEGDRTSSESVTRKRGSQLALLAVLLGASLLVVAPAGQSRESVSLTLYVYFGYNNEISVRLADGTPVGTPNGTPTVIPAGYYTLSFEQPGCVQVPSFELQGPGVSVVNNLSGGEVTSATAPVNFQPSSTYTWRDDANRSVVYTFATSSSVVGTQSGAVVHQPVSSANGDSSNSDIVGSAVKPLRGTLIGSVTESGKLSLAFQGKSVSHLAAGRYRFSLTDKSTTAGFVLAHAHHTLSLTGMAFTGKHTGSIDLTAGTWTFAAAAKGGTQKPAFPVVVK